MTKIYINKIETVSHQFEVDVSKLPANVDKNDAVELYMWAIENQNLDNSNGEQIGSSECNIVDKEGKHIDIDTKDLKGVSSCL